VIRELARPRVWGVVLAVAVVQVAGSLGANRHERGAFALDAAGYVLLLLGPLVLLARQRHPHAVFYAVLLITAAYTARGYGYGPVFLSLVVAFLAAGIVGSRWLTYPVFLVGYGYFVWVVPAITTDRLPPLAMVIGIAAWLFVLLAVAEGLRQRRIAVEARRQRMAAAARSEVTERMRRASEERLDIARELHDVLAHSLSLINVQSSVALELWEREPARAAPALAAIKTASREALGEVHALLTSLRDGEEGAPTAPAPSVSDLDSLVQRTRMAGIEVRTQVRGSVVRLPSVVDVAAARIIQESLTNVARHSRQAGATVLLEYAPDRLHIRVDDDGSPADGGTPASSGGSGIPGMRERASALGGQLCAGRRTDGGFRVDALLPIAAALQTPANP